MDNKEINLRVGIVLAVTFLLFILFALVLYQLQIVYGGYYLEESSYTVISYETVSAARGSVYDSTGKELIGNEVVYEVTLDTKYMGDNQEEVVQSLLSLYAICTNKEQAWTDSLPISQTAPYLLTTDLVTSWLDDDNNLQSTDSLLKRYLDTLSEDYQAILGSNPSATTILEVLADYYGIDDTATEDEIRFVVGVLYSVDIRTIELTYLSYTFATDVSMDFITAVKEQQLNGVSIDATTTRVYGTSYAAHLLGRTGDIWPSELDSYLEQGYDMDATVGKDGVELAFESYLRGSSGTSMIEYSTSGAVVSQSWVVDSETGEEDSPQPGNNVILTIDEEFQGAVENSLATRVPELNDDTGGAAAVVLDMTGGVLAMASYPTYDITSIYSDANAYAEAASDPLEPFLNRATSGTFSPGSTIKMAVATAALEEGIIEPNTIIYCTGRYTYYERLEDQPMCWIYRQYGSTHGSENVSEAITDSCNIFFYDIGTQMGITTLNQYATMFGLGQSTGIEVGDKAGVLAGPEYTESLDQIWYDGNTMYAAIGQENTAVTPIQLANYIVTLVNGGSLYPVHLLKEVKTYDFSEVVETYEPVAISDIDIEEENLNAILQGMYDVANNSGTISNYFANLDVEVGAKTGSAQVAGQENSNGLFVCFAPYDDPEIAIAIVVQGGGSGTEQASIAADILEYYFSVGDEGQTPTVEGTLNP